MSKCNRHVNLSGVPPKRVKGGTGGPMDVDSESFPLVSTSQTAVTQQMRFAQLEEARQEASRRNAEIAANLNDDNRAMLKAMRGKNKIIDDIDTTQDDHIGSTEYSQGASNEGPGLSDDMAIGEVADAVFDAIYDQEYHRPQKQWRERMSSSQDNWSVQLEELADSYLKWKASAATSNAEAPAPGPADSSSGSPIDFDITIIDMYTLETSIHVVMPQSARAPPFLVAQGFLPTTPINPSIAISLRTLQLYEFLRHRKPSFGIEPFTKVLCDLYGHPFRTRWSKAFADTFEIFLAIKRVIKARLSSTLAHDTENWRVLHSCPACFNELVDEPELLWHIMYAMDGNTSLKRILDKGRGDERVFHSDYIIPIAEVNKCDFKAKAHDGGGAPIAKDREDEWEDVEEDAGNSDSKTSECVKNWKAAQSDSKKRVLGFFDESGVFASACRHGILLWVTDMIQSGEQFKYPLSIVRRALDVLGDRQAVGYDIGCTFGISIANSPLGARFNASGLRCLVNAYHGYAHNFQCQVQNHPNNITGVGLEDFETMERYFAGSNAVAVLVRHATKYKRRLFMDLYFKQADADKYLTLGDFLLGNYRQACNIVEVEGKLLNEIMEAEEVTASDLDRWQGEQREYFQSTLGRQSEEDVYRVAYVELLQEHEKTSGDVSARSTAFLGAVPEDWHAERRTYQSADSETRHLETARRRARERLLQLEFELQQMETALKIEICWTPFTPQYAETVKHINEHCCHRALEHLQRLVVQRLFELHRLNLSGVGYKARTLLADVMRKRSRAIKTAVECYNAAVISLGRSDTLDWERVSRYSFVEEFELLKVNRADLLGARWKEPIIREAMKKHQRIKRAKEEIERVHVEMLRVYSHMASEEDELQYHLDSMAVSDNPLFPVLAEIQSNRLLVNAIIRKRLVQITALPKYSGPQLIQKRKKGEPEGVVQLNDPLPRPPTLPIELDDDEIRNDAESDEGQVGGIVDFIADLVNG